MNTPETTDLWGLPEVTTSFYSPDDGQKPQKLAAFTVAMQMLIGLLIICGNTVVLIVLHKISTLAKLTRFLLGNLAVADCIFGSTCIVRGALSLIAGMEVASYCPHLMGIMGISITYTYGTTAIMSGHMVYLVVKGANYDKEWASKVVMVIMTLTILGSCSIYPLVFLFVEDSDNHKCSASSGHIHKHYFGIVDVAAIILIILSLICQMVTAMLLRRKLRIIGISKSKSTGSVKESGISIATTRSNIETMTTHDGLEPNRVGRLDPRSATAHFNLKESIGMEAISLSHTRNASTRKAYQPGNRSSLLARVKRERHTLKIIATISVCLFIFMSPAIIVQFINAFIPFVNIPSGLPEGLMTLALLNSFMNVIIYIIRDSSFRKAVGDLLKCTSPEQNLIITNST